MYVKITNGTPQKYTLGLLRRENPNVSFPKTIPLETLAEYDVYPLKDTPQPTYSPQTHRLEEQIELYNDEYYRTWTVTERPAEEVTPELLAKIAQDRYETETSGVYWEDTVGVTWYLDTTPEGQNRLTSAFTSAQNGLRTNGSVWKTAKIINGEPQLTYRPTDNIEIVTWANLVHAHVQKCFEAEAIASNKVMSGDLTATFEQEFSLL